MQLVWRSMFFMLEYAKYLLGSLFKMQVALMQAIREIEPRYSKSKIKKTTKGGVGGGGWGEELWTKS